jgi:K+-sensing histidine kinase KdpD
VASACSQADHRIVNRTQITKGGCMSSVKAYFLKYFEQIVVLFILAAVVVLNYFIAEKLALLNLFYLPAIVAGFVLGKRNAVLTSIFSITAVTFYLFLNYDNFKQSQFAYVNIISWASFLILCSIVVGHLHEENEKRIVQLKNAYMGILEILSKYLESSDKYTQGHSVPK